MYRTLPGVTLCVGLLAFAACGDTPSETGTAPDPALVGEYQLYLYEGFPLPARFAPVHGTGQQGWTLSSGTLTLRGDGSYAWTQEQVGGGGGFAREGRYDVAGDSVLVQGAPWPSYTSVLVWRAPDVLTLVLPDDPRSSLRDDSIAYVATVYVRTGADPGPMYRYRRYDLIAFDAHPVPYYDPDDGTNVGSGSLWLFDSGRFDRVTWHIFEEGPLLSQRGTYTAEGAVLTFTGAYPSTGTVHGDTVTVAGSTYVPR